MLLLAGFLEHLQKGFLSIFLYVLSSIYHQEVRQSEKTSISNVIPEQVQEASLLQINCHVIISYFKIYGKFALYICTNTYAFCMSIGKYDHWILSRLPSKQWFAGERPQVHPEVLQAPHLLLPLQRLHLVSLKYYHIVLFT